MRSPSALTGRTTDRVTQTATATARTIATRAITMMKREPELAVAGTTSALLVRLRRPARG